MSNQEKVDEIGKSSVKNMWTTERDSGILYYNDLYKEALKERAEREKENENGQSTGSSRHVERFY